MVVALLFAQSVFAQAYGEGVYGGSGNNSVYGGGSGEDHDDGDDEDENQEDDTEDESEDNNHLCDDTKPGDNPPQITKAVVNKSAKTIALTFASGAGPREGFEIRYTTNPEDFSGVDHYDVDKGRNSYDRTINITNTSADYYIKVRAVNGCAKGPYSKTETVNLGSSLKVGTTTFAYANAPMPVEQGGGSGGGGEVPGQTGEMPQNQNDHGDATGSSGSGGTTDAKNPEIVPGLTGEDASDGSVEQGFNWNPLENMLLLGIIGAFFFTTFGIMVVRRLIA